MRLYHLLDSIKFVEERLDFAYQPVLHRFYRLLQVVHVALESEAVPNLLLEPSFVIVQPVDMLGHHLTQLHQPEMMCLFDMGSVELYGDGLCP